MREDLKCEEKNEAFVVKKYMRPDQQKGKLQKRDVKNEVGNVPDQRTCWCCGYAGHVKYNCPYKDYKCS